MELNQLNIEQLVELRTKMILEKKSTKEINIIIQKKEEEYSTSIFEDTAATGGPGGAVSGGDVGSGGVAYASNVGGGMGPVVNAQPSSLAGATIGSDWSDHGGTIGSGDVSNPLLSRRKEMGTNHGARTGKKSRVKKLDLKSLKNSLSKRQDFTTGASPKKVMSFADFQKDDINKVTKVSK